MCWWRLRRVYKGESVRWEGRKSVQAWEGLGIV